MAINSAIARLSPSITLSSVPKSLHFQRPYFLSNNPNYSSSTLSSHFRPSSATSDHPTLGIAQTDEISVVESASEVVKKFYGGINGRDLSSVVDLISLHCVYEDLVFPQPFVGRKNILEFFEKFLGVVDKDLQFAIEKISTEDSSAVGVTWHLEWKGKPFPFSRGCSFYQLEIINGKRQIIYARDVAEPAIKPGESVLAIIRGVTWLLQRFPQLADRF